MAHDVPLLRLELDSRERFLDEYERNISNGGIFVETDAELDLRDRVCVQIALTYCRKRITLVGEIVHRVPAELAVDGARAGVAVQFSVPVARLRESFAPFADRAAPGPCDRDPGPRVERRTPAQMKARVRASGEDSRTDWEGRTRNLSTSGVLLSAGSEPAPLGAPVELVLDHPAGTGELEVEGTVIRHLESGSGRVAGLAVEFEASASGSGEVSDFVESVRALEHSRRLGLITGVIDERGLAGLLERLGSTTPRGTLTITNDVEEGVVSFELGQLLGCSLGGTTGAKALARMLAWDAATYELRADTAPDVVTGPPLEIDDALAQALVLQGRRGASDPLLRRASGARVCLGVPPDHAESLVKTERAILDLAAVEITVGKVADVIPEPDVVVCRTLREMARQGWIRIVDAR